MYVFDALGKNPGRNAFILDGSSDDAMVYNTSQLEEILLLVIHILTELPIPPNDSLGRSHVVIVLLNGEIIINRISGDYSSPLIRCSCII